MRIHDDDTATIGLAFESEPDSFDEAIDRSDSLSHASVEEFEVVPEEMATPNSSGPEVYEYRSLHEQTREWFNDLTVRALTTDDVDIEREGVADGLVAATVGGMPGEDGLQFTDDARIHVRFSDGARYVFPTDEIEAGKTLPDYPFDYRASNEFSVSAAPTAAEGDYGFTSYAPDYPHEVTNTNTNVPTFTHHLSTEFPVGQFRTLAGVKQQAVLGILATPSVLGLLEEGYREVEAGVGEVLQAMPTSSPTSVASAVKTVGTLLYEMDGAAGTITSGLDTLISAYERSEVSTAFVQVIPHDDLAGDSGWPTVLDLRSLVEIEQEHYATTVGDADRDPRLLDEYDQLLSDQARGASEIRTREGGDGLTIQLVADGTMPDNRHPPEEETGAMKTAQFIVSALRLIEEAAGRQREILDDYRNAAPATETPRSTETTVIAGVDFYIDPDSGDALVVGQKSSGTKSFDVERFRVSIENADEANGRYRLADVTSDPTFDPGDEYGLDRSSLDLRSEFDWDGSIVTLEYELEGEWVDVVESDFS